MVLPSSRPSRTRFRGMPSFVDHEEAVRFVFWCSNTKPRLLGLQRQFCLEKSALGSSRTKQCPTGQGPICSKNLGKSPSDSAQEFDTFRAVRGIPRKHSRCLPSGLHYSKRGILCRIRTSVLRCYRTVAIDTRPALPNSRTIAAVRSISLLEERTAKFRSRTLLQHVDRCVVVPFPWRLLAFQIVFQSMNH